MLVQLVSGQCFILVNVFQYSADYFAIPQVCLEICKKPSSANIYLFKVSNRNTRKRCDTLFYIGNFVNFFIVNMFHTFLVFLLLTLSIYLFGGLATFFINDENYFLVFKKDSSPGPGYMVHPSITRYGKDGAPQYSILGRQKDPSMFILLL